MVSDGDRRFSKAAGFWNMQDNTPLPGVSAFAKQPDGKILRTGLAPFGEFDNFCAIWHLFALLKDGAGDWQP
jgi:hypothetical protein